MDSGLPVCRAASRVRTPPPRRSDRLHLTDLLAHLVHLQFPLHGAILRPGGLVFGLLSQLGCLIGLILGRLRSLAGLVALALRLLGLVLCPVCLTLGLLSLVLGLQRLLAGLLGLLIGLAGLILRGLGLVCYLPRLLLRLPSEVLRLLGVLASVLCFLPQFIQT